MIPDYFTFGDWCFVAFCCVCSIACGAIAANQANNWRRRRAEQALWVCRDELAMAEAANLQLQADRIYQQSEIRHLRAKVEAAQYLSALPAALAVAYSRFTRN